MTDTEVREAVAKVLPISNKTFEIWCGRLGGEVSYRDPLEDMNTCIAAWRELSEEQRFDVLANWPGATRTAPLWTEGEWFIPAGFLSDPDAARILATAIAEEVIPEPKNRLKTPSPYDLSRR
jgi:hypothetical protein